MSDIDERRIGDLIIQIDRHLCVGFGDCVDVASEAFELDSEGIAVVRERAPAVRPERVIEACRACPVDALSAFDPSGTRLAP